MARKQTKKSRRKSSLSSLGEVHFIPVLILIQATVFVVLNFFLKNPLPDELVLTARHLARGWGWTIITSGFLHETWLHLALNMLGLFVFGRIVEEEMGPQKTAFIYFGALIFSMILSIFVYTFIFYKNVALVGASGAVMGLIAAATLRAPLRITYEMILPLPVMMKGWMFFYADIRGLLGGERDGISHWAHLGGFLSVMFLVYFLSARDREKMQVGFLINLVSLAVFLTMRRWLLFG